MRILYANLIERHANWGAEYFLNDAFIAAGAQMLPIDYTIKLYKLGDKFLQIDDFDIFFLQFGANFPLSLVKAVKRPRFFYCSELVNRYHAADHLFRADCFDHYFVRGPACARGLAARGWLTTDKISVHLSAFDPAVYNKHDLPKDIDVLFIGTLLPRRKSILERLSKKFKVQICNAFSNEASRLFNRAKIVLNIHAEDYLDTETRIFEVLGSSGFLITEKLSEENPFTKNELVQVSSIEEMEDTIEYYLGNESERNPIAQNGHIAAHSAHTYVHRANELIDTFRRYLPAERGEALDEKAVMSYARWKHVRRCISYIKHKKWEILNNLGTGKAQ